MAFDTREYEWADLTLLFGGNDIVEIRAVKIKEKIEREPLYAKGRQPFSIQSGNTIYEGEVTLTLGGYQRMVKMGKGSVLNLAGEGVFAFGNPSTGDALMTKRAEGIRFTDAEVSLKQGDKFGEVTLPFVCLNVNQDA